jgi:hypothetical protein
MISQTLQAMGDEAVAPLADRMGSDAEIGRHRFVAGILLARQDDAARWVSADGRLRGRTIERSCARSSSLIDNALFGRPVRIGHLLS